MKKSLQIIIKTALLITVYCSLNTAFAQAPQRMSYQAVIRNASNALVSNAVIGVRVSILQTTTTGTTVYSETHLTATNINGLATLQIGDGSATTGNFATINWANGPYFIKTETDPNGGTNYTITGTSQLLSVPFALYAATSGNAAPKIHFSSLYGFSTPTAHNATTVVKWTVFDQSNTSPSNSYNPATGEYTIVVPGYYSLYFDSIYDGSSGNMTGFVRSCILINGMIESINQMRVPNSEWPVSNCTTQREKWLNQGDVITFTVLQNYSSVQPVEISPYTQCGIHLIHN